VLLDCCAKLWEILVVRFFCGYNISLQCSSGVILLAGIVTVKCECSVLFAVCSDVDATVYMTNAIWITFAEVLSLLLSLGPIFLQCFDTVGWVISPVKTRPRCDLLV